MQPDQQALTTLAAVTERAMARAGSIRFALAETANEQRAIYHLRYQTVIERGWAQPADYPDGMERDADDGVALHIMGLDGNSLVACARLIFPNKVKQLPTERIFGVHVEPCGKVVDLGRQIVARSHSNMQHVIFAALLGRCWLEAQSQGYYHVCGDFTPSMIRLYRLLGLAVTTLGPPRHYFGEERIPIVQDVVSAVTQLSERYLKEVRHLGDV
jgi:N-acyl-L-homoserine lactone synthetase